MDATLFVLASHSDEVGDIQHVFRLVRDPVLWERVRAVPTVQQWQSVVLPHGAWVAYEDGTRPTDRPDEELGFLFADPYGGALFSRLGSRLAALRGESEFNNAVLDFIGQHFGSRDIVVFWR